MSETVRSGQFSVVSKGKSRAADARAVVVCLCAVVALGARAYAAGPDARQIMENVYKQGAAQDITMKASFQIFDKAGQSTKKDFTYRRIGSDGDSKTLVVFTAPKEIRGVALLSVSQPGANTLQYMYIPAQQRTRSVAAQERTAKFLGTDFTFEDIAQPAPSDWNYKLLSDSETIDGRKAYKIMATPVDASKSQYKYVYYWVAQDEPVILFAQFYDAQGQEVRQLHATDIRKDNGVWGARNTEMTTVADGTKTVLHIDSVNFNAKPDEKLFTPDGMAGALEK